MSTIDTKGIVLVVDDSAESVGMLNAALVEQGYTVLIAMDGQQAINITERITPDLVLMDALMPNMNGFEACQLLKDNDELSDLPIIFMTGLSDSESVIKGLESGGVDYLNKPIKLDELLARIKVHLTNARLTRSVRGALDEIGQATLTFTSGGIAWMSSKAKQVLNTIDIDNTEVNSNFTKQIQRWLSHSPRKHSSLNLQQLSKPLQLKYLGQSSPGEHLLRLLNNDEQSIRESLRQRFKLTERESEVTFWLTKGKTNREIAQILTMSPRTVNKHLEAIFQKLEVDNRTSATALCLEYFNDH
ncbi:response regulator transcription factor [Vibrio hippocampi]|uniref:Protein-glutamate methylesterase/protein-glutamine glutaminase n=1 Tax=Vibrio hippocampi TaxID=654686 RepID=A0ABM8ZMW9_9VIBR|nr:response regulator [Vibrio hippocampi]CAH0529889.1 Protein-glutamate methylesterase/protein-glutamine glutaminase [Vibrio hippocampi]